MNCFNHPGVPAVGICKVCRKGLCMECAVDLEHGIACQNHRKEVEMLNSYTLFSLLSLAFMTIGIIINLSAAFMGFFMNKIDLFVFIVFIGMGMMIYSFFLTVIGSNLRKSKRK